MLAIFDNISWNFRGSNQYKITQIHTTEHQMIGIFAVISVLCFMWHLDTTHEHVNN